MKGDFPIDLVVTYVDNSDPAWLKSIEPWINSSDSDQRYRNWNVFKYWFRAVEKNMPFVRTVHLVVSNVEQVPKWLDQSKVHVVLHKEIIPERLLPTFNSTTIEMFLYKIPGLTEHFIYSNDDMFPVNPLSAEDFFKDWAPVYDLVERSDSNNTFRMQCRNSHRLASELAGKPVGQTYFYIKHSMDPMLRSVCKEVHEKAQDRILKVCTKFREPFNYTQYLFPDYALLIGLGITGNYSFEYISLNNVKYAVKLIKDNNAKIICINDSGNVQEFEKSRNILQQAFDEKFTDKSTFELTV